MSLTLNAAALSTPAVPPCPSWCSGSAGHEWESLDRKSSEVTRFHQSDPSALAWISARESADRFGRLTLDAPTIEVCKLPPYARGMTSEQARDMARALLDAAERLADLEVDAVARCRRDAR